MMPTCFHRRNLLSYLLTVGLLVVIAGGAAVAQAQGASQALLPVNGGNPRSEILSGGGAPDRDLSLQQGSVHATRDSVAGHAGLFASPRSENSVSAGASFSSSAAAPVSGEVRSAPASPRIDSLDPNR